ncbi:hypothetical protein L208DRAFT_1236666 [Tricholoma matsutake]|nr:hypothetical protein L208DRAFT_1236666 [Tricholoma matsutake 945]
MAKSSDSGKGYSYTGSGNNDQGNHWCSRSDNSTGSTGYHYSNNDGSYYYSNTNGSQYYNSGTGHSQYTSPSRDTYKSTGK